jgi:hypothetical protein
MKSIKTDGNNLLNGVNRDAEQDRDLVRSTVTGATSNALLPLRRRGPRGLQYPERLIMINLSLYQ